MEKGVGVTTTIACKQEYNQHPRLISETPVPGTVQCLIQRRCNDSSILTKKNIIHHRSVFYRLSYSTTEKRLEIAL